ncbi:MAG: tRNA (N6-isopentenyl adenosine(37)-C2)-methylthiotransferase MiaB [Clostridiales bacterium]|nr:tRNA (N6-isopentenyl adenosine(37)-C2)-methylthiotransferase MiaB [Clostridiales bacterium]
MSTVRISRKDLELQSQYCAFLSEHFLQKHNNSGKAPSFMIKTYGCQLNESDSEKMAGLFVQMGLEEGEDSPDVLMMNTCAIRENAEDRLFGNLGVWKARKIENPNMIIIICGCMMKQKENLDRIQKSFPFVDIVFGPQDIHRLPELIYARITGNKKVIDVSEQDHMPDDHDLPVLRKRKFRALVPIMYGCNNFCTYCVVPYTRGRERSRDFDRIIRQLNDLSGQGFEEVMLLGQNVNSYGNDAPGMPEFPDLLMTVAKMDLFSRIRFMTSHPKDVSDRLIDIIAEYPSIERHLHLPFQSGSNSVLSRMNRGYTRERYLETALKFRQEVPKGTISTDIIVGFPGETEEDFQDTLCLMEQVRFDSAFTFIYSSRPGTVAAGFEDSVPEKVISERFSRLLELQNAHSLQSNRSVIGEIDEVLIEGFSHTNESVFTGRTSSNRLINFTMPEGTLLKDKPIVLNAQTGLLIEGKKAMVRLLRAKTFSIEGELEHFIDG